jgi:hypothetical protein
MAFFMRTVSERQSLTARDAAKPPINNRESKIASRQSESPIANRQSTIANRQSPIDNRELTIPIRQLAIGNGLVRMALLLARLGNNSRFFCRARAAAQAPMSI